MLALCLSACTAGTQPPVDYVSQEHLTRLPRLLKEISGMAEGNNGSVYAQNDGGNPARLYEVSPMTGEVLREIKIKNAENKDWEELAEDKSYIYIGDFGNNLGSREHLRIYRVSKKDLKKDDEVKADEIELEYPDQESFHKRSKHNFDCEAMAAIGDSLYLFTKNRDNHNTNVYSVPNTPGDYKARYEGTFDTGGKVTSADYKPGNVNKLALLGYNTKGGHYRSFLYLMYGFKGTDFFNSTKYRLEVAPNLQAESVIFNSDSTVLISNEGARNKTVWISKINLAPYLPH